ncbi:hypothetical protein KDL01_07930 [Actinospica durhamensis]|uniref:Uncharacterized protein n=1 Tax=Actinospica durhamensis TaxID=1508375 RepID=A0A941IMS6_9ACTN|nr:hypothetical protein [Actinospica durhamensis]MBR7833189.1 hypothetical protein [Actinospica durhamensis]
MLTRNQVTDEQAAILAACPRPRAFAPSALVMAPVSFRSVAAAPSVAAVPAGFGSVAAVRPVASERLAGGKGGWHRQMTGFGLGIATAAQAGIGAPTRTIEQDPQDQYYLTSRRETRTWRPPH